jgi:hypothetical protein
MQRTLGARRLGRHQLPSTPEISPASWSLADNQIKQDNEVGPARVCPHCHNGA